ncbi:MAG: amino acid racemase [Alphaproteobacteria bacterium]|nr:amino acid racemase [Alphaproteobacteria bacterium]
MNGENELVVGVIGGLGPEATLDFFGKVLIHSRAKTDQDHIHLVIENNPKTPDRNAAVAGTGMSPGPALARMAMALDRAGVDFIVMACNTAHAFEKDIRAATRKPFISLIDEVADEVRRTYPEARRVGLLAAQGCLDSRIYETAFSRHDIQSLQPEKSSQERFMRLLYRIKAGERGPDIRAGMRQLGEELVAGGADILIAGCTEVPLVLTSGENSKPLVDSTDVLARRCVSYARRLESLPVRLDS